MKKYFIGTPVFIIWSIITIIAIAGFLWECLDVDKFVLFAFVTSIILPLTIEIILYYLLMSYLIIDKNKIEKKFHGKTLVLYKWDEIKEIKLDGTVVYISKQQLIGPKKTWNSKEYIYIFYSEKLEKVLKNNLNENIRINF